MQIISTESISNLLQQQESSTPEFAAMLLMNAMANQGFILEYAVRPQMAMELGLDEGAWYPDEAESQEVHANEAMVAAAASLLAIVNQFTEQLPTITPAALIRVEQALQPALLVLATKKNATDDDLIGLLLDRCRQKDLLDFGLDILCMHKESLSKSATPASSKESQSVNLRELIKMRVIVDAMDQAAGEQPQSPEVKQN
jgi:hypothetical protein